MCDYSLAAMRTRLAVDGEELVVYRFPTQSLGLTSPAELEVCKPEVHGWRSQFNPRAVPCAVCIPPGACLLLRDIPRPLRRQLGLAAAEEVVFVQKSGSTGRHRDGFRFRNNQEVLLQQLAEGQRVDVRSLLSEAAIDEGDKALAESVVALA